MLLEDQNVQAEIRSFTSEAPLQEHASEALLQEHSSEASLQLLITIPIQGTCDMDMCPGKYICMDQSSNKGIYKDYVKKDIQCSFKTMNIDVLGKFHKGILS